MKTPTSCEKGIFGGTGLSNLLNQLWFHPPMLICVIYRSFIYLSSKIGPRKGHKIVTYYIMCRKTNSMPSKLLETINISQLYDSYFEIINIFSLSLSPSLVAQSLKQVSNQSCFSLSKIFYFFNKIKKPNQFFPPKVLNDLSITHVKLVTQSFCNRKQAFVWLVWSRFQFFQYFSRWR